MDDFSLVTNYLTKHKHACSSSRRQKASVIRLFRNFMSRPALDPVTARLTPLFNNDPRHKATIMSYTIVINSFLRHNATDAAITKAEKKFSSVRQGSLMPSVFIRNV